MSKHIEYIERVVTGGIIIGTISGVAGALIGMMGHHNLAAVCMITGFISIFGSFVARHKIDKYYESRKGELV